MKPLEDWRVNRGMTGSFLCWKFKEKKAKTEKNLEKKEINTLHQNAK